MDYPTIEDFVGNTPLVRLQRLPGNSTNTVLVKLEGNNPAGSVKDRAALYIIKNAIDVDIGSRSILHEQDVMPGAIKRLSRRVRMVDRRFATADENVHRTVGAVVGRSDVEQRTVVGRGPLREEAEVVLTRAHHIGPEANGEVL